MISGDLSPFGFQAWQTISRQEILCRDLVLSLPRVNGIYIIKASQDIARLAGSSDVIYIGHGKVRTRIQNLLFAFLPQSYKNYSTQHSASREFTRIIRETDLLLEVAYIQTQTKEEARALESTLLKQYCVDHIEPPPLNNTRK